MFQLIVNCGAAFDTSQALLACRSATAALAACWKHCRKQRPLERDQPWHHVEGQQEIAILVHLPLIKSDRVGLGNLWQKKQVVSQAFCFT
jgi:hypothetical protein